LRRVRAQIGRTAFARQRQGEASPAANDGAKPTREPNVLRWRLISATCLIVLLVTTCWLDVNFPFAMRGIWLLPLCLFIGLAAVGEMLDLLKKQPSPPDAVSTYAGALVILLASCVGCFRPDWIESHREALRVLPLWAVAFGVLLAFIAQMRRYEKPGASIAAVSLSTLIMVYVGVMMSFIILLRIEFGNARGMAALLSLVVVVKLSDTGAYACGRLFGRHKLAPKLSPGKTIEGAIGGLVAGCFGGWLMFNWLGPHMVDSTPSTPWWGWFLFGVVLTVAGVVGDLAESLLKRDADRKDSSTWLPGLGGVLDFMDSLLAAAPFAYLFWSCGIVAL
jgi:phosphatidate cytidylyltransferase